MQKTLFDQGANLSIIHKFSSEHSLAQRECKDIRLANRCPKPLDVEAGAGRASVTLAASLEYIWLFKPAAIVLEDVYRHCAIQVMFTQIRVLRIYDFEAFGLDRDKKT